MKKQVLKFIIAFFALFISLGANAQTYCAAGPSSTADSEITNVLLAGDNFGISKLLTCPGTAGVVNYTSTDSADVSLQTSYSVLVTFGTCGGVYSGAGQGWIDWNDDGDFTDAGESIGTWTGSPLVSGSTATNATFSFTVPATATLGTTRMRIMQWEGGNLPLNSCGTYTWGAVEDYKIKITNTPPPCPIPGSLASAPAATSATVSWASTGTAFDIQYGPIGFTLGAGTTVTSTTNSKLLTGLTPNTGYNVYVRNNCTASSNGTSGWSFSHTFYTTCVAISTFPYLENFDGPTWIAAANSATTPNSIDQCWSRTPVPTALTWFTHSGTTGSGGTGPSAAHSGLNYMYTEASGAAPGAAFYLRMPAMDLTSLTAPLLSFYYHMYGADMGNLSVEVSINGGTTWTSVLTRTGQDQIANSDPFKEELVDLTTFKSANTLVRFKATMGASFTSDMSIDDVSVAEAPLCPKPTAVNISNISATTATVNFLSSGTSFSVEWGPVGFVQGTGTASTTTATGYGLTGLPPNSLIDIYIQNNCTVAGNGLSAWVGPITFRTLCVGFAEGYFENFDALTTNTKNPCWYDFSTGGAHNVYAYATPTFSNVQAFSTPNVYYWYNNNATASYVVTPELVGLAGDTSQVRFRMAHNNFNASTVINVFVGTMSDRANPATITWHDTIQPAQYVWNEYTILLNNVPAGHKFVVFGRGNTNTFVEVDLDNFRFEGIPACPPPTSASAQAASSSSANLSWAGVGTTYNVEYGPVGFTQGTGATLTGVTSPQTLSGLFANTCYDIYIQNNCGTGTSPWYGPVSVCTPCNAASMPYTEDFAVWPPACMTFSKTSTWNWEASTTGGHAVARFWNFSSGTATIASPPINITQKAQVKFKWAHQYQTFYPDDRVVVRAHVLGSSQWDTLINLVGPTFNSPNSGTTTPPASLADFVPELFYLDSTKYVGQVAVVEFIALTDFGPNAYIDDLVVEAVPACPDPTSLSASNIQGYQANVAWSSAGGSSFTLEYGPQGFGQGSGTMVTATSSPQTLTGLTPVTCYDVYVRANCALGATSAWSGPLTFCTLVSCPAPTNVRDSLKTATSAIMKWKSGSATNWNISWGPGGTSAAAGTKANVTGTPTFALSGLTNCTPYTFWVRDSCGPGDVSVWKGPYNFTTAALTQSLPFVESFNFGLGCWEVINGGNTTDTWVGQTSYNGSTLDGTPFGFVDSDGAGSGAITLREQLITPPINASGTINLPLTVDFDQYFNSIFGDSASVDVWNGTQWVNVLTQTASAGSFATPNHQSINISAYANANLKVRFRYSDAGIWAWYWAIDNVVITGAPTCPKPTALGASSITTTSAIVNWTTGGASNWNIEYGPVGFMPGSGTFVNNVTSPYSLTGLNASTCYEFYVQDSCGLGDVSLWSGPHSFCTACGVVMAPFAESFNAGSTAPQCWTNSNVQANTSANALWKNTSSSWGNYGAQGIVNHTTGGVSYAMGVDASTPYNVDVELVTPFINVSSLSNVELKFWIFMNNTNLPGAHNDFQIDLYDGTAWNDSIFGYANDSTGWVEVTVPLSGYAITGPIQIRFAVYKVGTPVDFYDDIMIDDVTIDGAASACPPPTNFAAPVATIACDNMQVTWTPATGSIVSGILWGAAGFNPTLGGTLIVNAQTPQTISGLTPGTAYDFYLVDSCSAGMSNPVLLTATTVTAPMPTLAFTQAQTNTGATSANVTFDATGSTNYSSVTWDYGDGTANGTTALSVHAYTLNQAYTATLTLTNGCGSVDSSFTVNVTGIGIEETDLSRTLNIFPNPTSGAFTVSFNLAEKQDVRINVTDALGRVVIAKELGKVNGENTVSLDLSNNASGIYMVQIVTEEGTITKRITLRSK